MLASCAQIIKNDYCIAIRRNVFPCEAVEMSKQHFGIHYAMIIFFYEHEKFLG